MIIFIIMIFVSNYKLYVSLMSAIVSFNNLKKMSYCCKVICILSINLLKLLNTGLSGEYVLLFFNKLFDINISNKMMLSFMDEDTQNNIITTIEDSQSSSSTQNINYSSSNSITNIIEELGWKNTDTSDSEHSDSEHSDSEHSDSNSNYDSDISTNTKLLIDNMPNFNFSNFNQDLTLEEKYYYLSIKCYNKGMHHGIGLLDWLTNLLIQTDGTQASVDNLIESNLDFLMKKQRDAQLNNLAFFRNKPFLLNKVDKTPLMYPHVIPVFKHWWIYD